MNETEQSFKGAGWYLVPKQGFPNGASCVMCTRIAVAGQIVWAAKRVCRKVKDHPTFSHLNSDHTLVVHKDCMVGAVASAPLDTYNSIRDRIASGGPLWTE